MPIQTITHGTRSASYHASLVVSRLPPGSPSGQLTRFQSRIPAVEESLSFHLESRVSRTRTPRPLASGSAIHCERPRPIRCPLTVPNLIEQILGRPTTRFNRRRPNRLDFRTDPIRRSVAIVCYTPHPTGRIVSRGHDPCTASGDVLERRPMSRGRTMS